MRLLDKEFDLSEVQNSIALFGGLAFLQRLILIIIILQIFGYKS